MHLTELGAMCALIRRENVMSVLEIGSLFGATFARMLRWCDAEPAMVRGVAIDLPGGPWGKPESGDELRGRIDGLAESGYDVHFIEGNSRKPEVVAAARELGPYDFVFIDGDHSYKGAGLDWRNYGPMGRIVAFHDVHPKQDGLRRIFNGAETVMEVPRLWRELKAGHRHIEIIDPIDTPPLGIGVLWR